MPDTFSTVFGNLYKRREKLSVFTAKNQEAPALLSKNKKLHREVTNDNLECVIR